MSDPSKWKRTCLLIALVPLEAVARQTQARSQGPSSSLPPPGVGPGDGEMKDPGNKVYTIKAVWLNKEDLRLQILRL